MTAAAMPFAAKSRRERTRKLPRSSDLRAVSRSRSVLPSPPGNSTATACALPASRSRQQVALRHAAAGRQRDDVLGEGGAAVTQEERGRSADAACAKLYARRVADAGRGYNPRSYQSTSYTFPCWRSWSRTRRSSPAADLEPREARAVRAAQGVLARRLARRARHRSARRRAVAGARRSPQSLPSLRLQADLPRGALAVWVMLDAAKSAFERQTLAAQGDCARAGGKARGPRDRRVRHRGAAPARRRSSRSTPPGSTARGCPSARRSPTPRRSRTIRLFGYRCARRLRPPAGDRGRQSPVPGADGAAAERADARRLPEARCASSRGESGWRYEEYDMKRLRRWAPARSWRWRRAAPKTMPRSCTLPTGIRERARRWRSSARASASTPADTTSSRRATCRACTRT